MFEAFNERARRVSFFARSEACEFGSLSIQPEHILLGLLRVEELFTNRFLNSSVPVESIRKQIEGHTPLCEKTTADLPLSDECGRIIESTVEEAERLGDSRVGPEHLLLGILREESSFAAHLLNGRGVQLDAVRDELANLSAERKRQASRVLKIPNLRHLIASASTHWMPLPTSKLPNCKKERPGRL
jgi:ATP-dependent Clp protease ATP-binding subunit ClpC